MADVDELLAHLAECEECSSEMDTVTNDHLGQRHRHRVVKVAVISTCVRMEGTGREGVRTPWARLQYHGAG